MGKRVVNLVLVVVVLGVCGVSWGQKKASGPNPADGATDVITPLLRWTAGSTSAYSRVYLGTTPDLGPAQLVAAKVVGPMRLYYSPTPFEPGVVRYWRVDEVEKDGVTIHTGDVWMFMGQPVTAFWPEPADGSNAGPLTPNLTWRIGQSALKHQVYFGDSRDAVAARGAEVNKGTVEDPNYAPGALQPLTTYWWCVDEILATGGTEAGPIWSFTTMLPVDDFESYNDEENQGTRIYETWSDGYSDGSSGSVVGNLNPPFAEQTIIRSGKQSMPFEYNNVSTPFFSEAKIEFSPVADWSADVNVLTLHVRGGGVDFEVPVVSTPPALDGKVDDVWLQTPVQYVKTTINGAAPTDLADCSGLFRVLYDATNLYVLVDINDATLVQDSDPAQGWLDDRVEVFIDGGNDKTAAQDGTNDYQYCFRWNHGTVETPVEWYRSPGSLAGVQYGTTATAKSYLVEVKLPWSTLVGGPVKAGRLIGIDVVIDDDDDGGDTMDSQLAWHLPAGDPHRPIYWGTAKLADPQAKPDKLYVMLQDSANKKAIVTYPDAAVLKSSKWVEWQIPLSDFAGISLTKVRWLYVGVGDRNNPMAGGAGKLFFDDIYLTKPAPQP
jgi:hypothetical protein